MTRFDRVPRAMNATQSSTPGRNETREDRPMTADLYPVQVRLVTSKTQAQPGHGHSRRMVVMMWSIVFWNWGSSWRRASIFWTA